MKDSAALDFREEAGYNFTEIQFEGEHFNDGYILYNYDWEAKILPVTGLIFHNEGIFSPLPKYHYCPDQRLYTFRLLGKVSPGLPPPFLN